MKIAYKKIEIQSFVKIFRGKINDTKLQGRSMCGVVGQ